MSTFQHLDDLLQSFVENQIVGCGCIVAKEGKTIYENYFGYADREKQMLMNEGSIHRLYSTTKVIVCTAAMLLYERGKFLLNDPLEKYLPEFANMKVANTSSNGYITYEPAKSPILVKHIFSMTAGIPYNWGNFLTSSDFNENINKVRNQENHTLEQLVKAIAASPLMHEPGTHWLYGYSHDVVARLVEVISGQTIEQFIQQELLEPLEMKETGYRFKKDFASRFVPLYSPNSSNELVVSIAEADEYFDPNSTYNGGGVGIFSTVRDYTKFAQMMANEGVYNGKKIIGKATINLIRANQLNEAQLQEFQVPYTSGYGYGLGVRTLMNPVEANYGGNIGEFGWTGMSGTYAVIDPAEKLSIVYMHQRIPNLEFEHHLRVRNTVYGCL